MLFDQQLPDSTAIISPIDLISNVSLKTVVPNMATFPTPPSSSGDSPQPIYFVASPNSNSFSVSSPEMSQHYIQAQILPTDTDMTNIHNLDSDRLPYLRFIEQPTNKFRFRYKSEMAGTHGSLCGMTSDKSRKQTYPTVELVNCPEKALVRCSIYQYNVNEDFKPHPHRLIMKRGREEFDDPHDIPVGPEEGFVATFHSMGIIHTARKNIVAELVRKKSQLKKELIASIEGNMRELTTKELTEIKGLAEQESKSINLNIVCLRFDAFLVKNGIRNPICRPLYSHGINNLKCALTGDLKIVRMDHCTSPAKGGKEVFLLVERVTKKNIKIRFFELDDDEQEVWEGWGKFSELDVHHQYAIVFKTPAYDKVPNITGPVNVYMELVRPSDNARSEWKEFRFVPSNEFKPGSKRPRSSCDSSSSSYNSGSLSSNELPATIPVVGQIQSTQPVYPLPAASSWNQRELITEDQLEVAINDFDSDEFRLLYDMFAGDLPNDMGSTAALAVDSPATISRRLNDVHISRHHHLHGGRSSFGRYSNRYLQYQSGSTVVKMEVSSEDLAKAERTYNELRSFIKSTDAHERAPAVLQYHLGEDKNNRRNNALHVFIGLNRKDEVTFLLKMLVLSKKFDLSNVPNAEGLTPLHIAVKCRNEEFAAYLLHCEADPLRQDNQGRTVLHIAIKSGATPSMFEMLLSNKYNDALINLEDYEGATPLNFAIEKRNMTAIKILCKCGANINRKHQKNGFTPLRIAVENQYAEAIKFILENPKFALNMQNDFQNVSPFQAANMRQSSEEVMAVCNKYMMDNDIPLELKKEIEDEDDESNDELEDIEFKPELVDQENDPDILYTGLKNLTPKCLDEVSAILDESGKYGHLADLLDLGHLIHTGIISNERSISRNLLQYAIEKDNVKILDIRNFLENLDEFRAVQIMDHMARELQTMVRS